MLSSKLAASFPPFLSPQYSGGVAGRLLANTIVAGGLKIHFSHASCACCAGAELEPPPSPSRDFAHVHSKLHAHPSSSEAVHAVLSLARPFLAFLRGLGFSSTSCRFFFLGFGLGRFPALPPPPPDGLERCAAPASPPSESESDSDESEITTQSMLALLHSSARTKQQKVPTPKISSRSRWLGKVVAPDFDCLLL